MNTFESRVSGASGPVRAPDRLLRALASVAKAQLGTPRRVPQRPVVENQALDVVPAMQT